MDPPPTYKELSEMHEVGSLERVLSDLENAKLVDLNNALIKARRESADADAQWEKAYDRTQARVAADKKEEIKGQWTLKDWQRLAQKKDERVNDLVSEINRRANRGMEKLDPVLQERLPASGEAKVATPTSGGSKRRRPKRTKHKMHRTKKRKLSKKRKSKKRRTKKKKKTRRRRR